jgi:hypothetical protein
MDGPSVLIGYTTQAQVVDALPATQSETERLELARQIGADGVTVLAQAWLADARAFMEALRAVASLRAIGSSSTTTGRVGLGCQAAEQRAVPQV